MPQLLGNPVAWEVIDAMIAATNATKYHVFFAHLHGNDAGGKNREDCRTAGKAVRIAACKLLVREGVLSRSEIAEYLRCSIDSVDGMRKRKLVPNSALGTKVSRARRAGKEVLERRAAIGSAEPFTPPQGEHTYTENARATSHRRPFRAPADGPILVFGGHVGRQ